MNFLKIMKKIFLSILLIMSLISCSKKDVPTVYNHVIKYNGIPVPEDLIEVYSHRAGRGLMPEQTMPAYEEALRLGADYMDMDIGMTKDSVLVITHDLGLNPNLTRDKDGNWITEATPIHSMTLKELQTYNVGMLKPGTRYASFFPFQHSVDTYIPTLEEAIDYIISIAGDKVGFQIEIKNDPTKPEMTATPLQFAKALNDMILRKNIINRTEVQAFDWQCLVELKKINGNIKTAFLTDHTTEVMDDTETGTWTAGLKPKDFGYSLPLMVKHLEGDCWEPFEGDLTEKDLAEARRQGLKVVVWGWPELEKTECDYDMVIKMIQWKVDGLIADRPDIIKGLLAARGYNVSSGFNVPVNY